MNPTEIQVQVPAKGQASKRMVQETASETAALSVNMGMHGGPPGQPSLEEGWKEALPSVRAKPCPNSVLISTELSRIMLYLFNWL